MRCNLKYVLILQHSRNLQTARFTKKLLLDPTLVDSLGQKAKAWLLKNIYGS